MTTPTPSPQEVLYAGLFHDIGKLFYRANAAKGSNHKSAGLKALEELYRDASSKGGEETLPALIRDAVKYHHAKDLAKVSSPHPLSWLIYEADNLAAGIDRRAKIEKEDATFNGEGEGDEGDKPQKHWTGFIKSVALQSVFDAVKPEVPQGATSQQHHYAFQLQGDTEGCSDRIQLRGSGISE